MWQVYAMRALDLTRERIQEAEMARLARLAQETLDEERRRHAIEDAVGPGRARRALAGALRRFGSGAESLAAAACSAASRVEGRLA
jgi:hypothetical protein